MRYINSRFTYLLTYLHSKLETAQDTRGDKKVLQLDILAFMYLGKFCVTVMYDSYTVFWRITGNDIMHNNSEAVTSLGLPL